MNELISVIVPVYNVQNYIDKCIDSICSQTYRTLEIILVDDGSTDLSGEICDKYQKKDGRIRVIHKENGGLSDARNHGIDNAKGLFYCFIDSDDYITENTVEKMYTAIQKYESDIAVCNMIRFYDDGEVQDFYRPTTEEYLLQNENRLETLKQPSVCNKMFRAELFDNIRFPKGKYYEDTFIYHILAHRANSIALTGHDGYWYYCRKDSILGQPVFTNRYFDFIEAVWLRAMYLLENNVRKYGIEACLSMYIAYANADKNIIKTEENMQLFAQTKERYSYLCNILINDPEMGIKQKIRLLMLKYIPKLHHLIY